MIALSFILFIFAVICYSIKELKTFGKLKWMSRFPWGFWGVDSWKRKYKEPRQQAPDNSYYRFFKIKYKERFPGSATIFVFLTDGYHLCQWFFIKLIVLSIVTFDGDFSIKWFLIYLAIWYIIFNLTYKLLSK